MRAYANNLEGNKGEKRGEGGSLIPEVMGREGEKEREKVIAFGAGLPYH